MKSNLEIAINAAMDAGKAIMKIYESGDFDIKVKGDDSPLTKADIASHEIIMSYLSKTNIHILSEEGKAIPYSERKDWSQLWIVDPIDGTKEFIKRNGEFTVNIALIEDKHPVLGVILVPVTGELYFATQKKGAYKVVVDDLNISSLELILEQADQLPIKKNLERPFTIVASKSHMSKSTDDYLVQMRTLHKEINIISKGSSLKLCMVAEGKADCYPRFSPTMEWDTAAGQAICACAGFDLIDWKSNQTMQYNREELLNPSFLVKAY